MAAPRAAPGRRREATCNAILEATSLLIAEKGVDGFTLSEAAQRAQVNRALIYHYFHDRANLIERAIDHILDKYRPEQPDLNAQSVEDGVRMHIEHPEIARFFFHMLLNGHRLGRLGQRLLDTIAGLEAYRREHAPDVHYDAAFALITLVLAQLSWAFSREEFARLLGMSVEEADERFIESLRGAAELGIRAMMGNLSAR